MSKADYVREQLARPSHRPHTCHWPNCNKQVPPAMWGCKTHWFKLPQHLRNWIWSTYVPGQEVTMTPSLSYIEAAEAVQRWIQEQPR